MTAASEDMQRKRLAAFRELAALSRAEFDARKKEAALSLGLPLGKLEAEVESVRQAQRAAEDWECGLSRSATGDRPRPTLDNASHALEYAPPWRGRLRLNLFAQVIEIDGRDLNEDDTLTVTKWLQRVALIDVKSNVTFEAIRLVARQNAYHPVRDYLGGLTWDGVPRAETWLIDHLGAEDTPLNRAFGKRFLMGAARRVMEPGCKVDTCLILESWQGIGKSEVFYTMAGPKWISDQGSEWKSKDAKEEMAGTWIRELAELNSIKKSDVDTIKAFLSHRVDRYRPSYGRMLATFPRQAVFAGTINPGANGYLKDETGERRFWPVLCAVGWTKGRRVDLTALAGVRDQLWGEAAFAVACGEPHWLDNRELEDLQEEATDARKSLPAIEALIRAFLDMPAITGEEAEPCQRQQVTLDELLQDALHLHVSHWKPDVEQAVGRVMAGRRDWKKSRSGPRNDRFWCWKRVQWGDA